MKKPGAELAFGFGGLWTEFKGDSGTKSEPTLSEALSVGIGFGSLIDRSIRVTSA
jgi:hypothetical protein